MKIFIRKYTKGAVLPLLVFLLPLAVTAQCDFNANCRKAYELLFSYKLPEATQLLNAEKAANPKNLTPLYLESYRDLLNVFFSENPADYSRMQKAEDERESALGKNKPSSPYGLFFLSEVYVHDALVRVKFGDNMSAAYKIKSANSLLKECTKKYPEFLPARKNLLLMEAGVGTLPSGYRAILSILGFHGNLNQATNEYRQFLNQLDASSEYKIFGHESRVFGAFIDYYLLNKATEAWQDMQAATMDCRENPLSAFFRATMAMRTHHSKEAIEALTPYIQDPPILQLDYLYGTARLQQLSPQGGSYLSHFLEKYKGENYIKDAYLKLAWAFLIKEDTTSCRNCLQLVLKYGNARFEEDKNALKEARRKPLPDIHLLKARLLYDGGFYEKAKIELASMPVTAFKSSDDKVEALYRLGRINEGMGIDNEALRYYGMVTGFKLPKSYFPPASCLYMGMIYERQKNYTQAKKYYKLVLQFSGYPYEDSFSQKANAGLKRIGE